MAEDDLESERARRTGWSVRADWWGADQSRNSFMPDEPVVESGGDDASKPNGFAFGSSTGER